MTSFDPKPYATVPTRSPGSTLSLARALIAAADSQPQRVVAARLSRLGAATDALQAAWVEVSRPEVEDENPQPYDVAIDRAWSALRARLEAWAQVDLEPSAANVRVLEEQLFPTGLDFLQRPYAEQWAQSERRLVLIDGDGLVEDIEQLAGAPFLAAVRKAHLDYGRVLGITGAKEEPPQEVRVIESMRRARAAIASYARVVVGLTDEDDDEAVERMHARLRPIVDARRPRSSGSEGEGEVGGDASAEGAEGEVSAAQ